MLETEKKNMEQVQIYFKILSKNKNFTIFLAFISCYLIFFNVSSRIRIHGDPNPQPCYLLQFCLAFFVLGFKVKNSRFRYIFKLFVPSFTEHD